MRVFFVGLGFGEEPSTQTGDTGRFPELRYIGAEEWNSLPLLASRGIRSEALTMTDETG